MPFILERLLEFNDAKPESLVLLEQILSELSPLFKHLQKIVCTRGSIFFFVTMTHTLLLVNYSQ